MAVLVCAASTERPPVAQRVFQVAAPAVAFATIEARCAACDWQVEGREAVTLIVTLDGRYSQHLPLVRGPRGTYDVLLGAVEPGRHIVRARIDPEHTAAGLRAPGAASFAIREVAVVSADEPQYQAVALAPFLYVRENAIGRFTDAPVFMWYEQESTTRGTRYRYSVIFTNEDGGTPTDRLMATWGRSTDIEYIYSVELDRAGTILAEDYQGPDHEVRPFRGEREKRHPLLWVATDNNMVRDQGTTGIRYAPAPVAFSLAGTSREAVMDAHPWIYAVASKELAREGKIVENAAPGSGPIPDPRRFVYLEGCGVLAGAALTLEIGIGDSWLPFHRGVPEFRIARDGCFRSAAPLPAAAGSRHITRLRVSAHSRASRDGTPVPTAKSVEVRINTMFMLDDEYRPGSPILRPVGPATIEVGATPYEIAIP